MQSVQQECHEFLRILLLVSRELRLETTDGDLLKFKRNKTYNVAQDINDGCHLHVCIINENQGSKYLELPRSSAVVATRPHVRDEFGVSGGNLSSHAERILDVKFGPPEVCQHVIRQRRHVAHALKQE